MGGSELAGPEDDVSLLVEDGTDQVGQLRRVVLQVSILGFEIEAELTGGLLLNRARIYEKPISYTASPTVGAHRRSTTVGSASERREDLSEMNSVA